MLDNFTYPADIFPSSRFYVEDLAESPLVLETGAEGIPSVRALDRIPDPHPERLKKLTVQFAKI
jgi:o-succinylbenzoate synthase